MTDWLVPLIAAFFGAFGGSLLTRYFAIKDRKNLRDKSTITKLKKMFVDTGLYIYLRNHDFGEPFDIETISSLEKFCVFCEKNPDFVFINSELEFLRKELLKAVINFNAKLAMNSFPSGDRINRIHNPDYNDEIDYVKYHELRVELNKLVGYIIQNYDSYNYR